MIIPATLKPAFFLAVYLVIYMAIAFAFARLRIKPDRFQTINEKILPGPGESLQRKLESLDDALMMNFFLGLIVPSGVCLVLAKFFPLWPSYTLIVIGLVVFLILFIYFCWKSASLMINYRDVRLGYFGERHVAEQLTRLRGPGCHVFHDVMINGSGGNIDHVLVSPVGVFAIETKTWRKRKKTQKQKTDSSMDAPEHKIYFDGQKVTFPDGRVEWKAVRQAQTSAHRLEDWLNQHRKLKLQVVPLLTFPFWYVQKTTSDMGALHVLNPKQIPGAIDQIARSLNLPILTEAQIDLVVCQLDTCCRDVEL